ncbi:hypothetical protein EI165_08370 [Pseudoalteromonas nigrifaciens]|uniref:hypothetical protein n=1 Tax=Pseudoalteromonas nigrifaciens TaxID=28109 RepID=UPI0017887709|nr:hypothetical protein [Pseudoalteromonas nigrifaciens]MBE0420137.1 hypothetical protein [Pseudoalteromonas nigrifaciens]
MNKFKVNLKNLIIKTKKSFDEINYIKKTDGSATAHWNEDWACHPNQRRIFLKFSAWVDNHNASQFDLVRTFAVETINRNLAPYYIVPQIQYAARAISSIRCEIWDIQQSDLDDLTYTFNQLNYSEKCAGIFWTWCKNNNLIPSYLITPVSKDSRERSYDEEEKRNADLLVSDEKVAAIGVTFNELYSDRGLETYGFQKHPQAYLAIAFATLSLATPSRANIEIWGLPSQRVKSHVNIETGSETHSLFWKGSKNHPDNRTHLLSELSDNINKIFDVIEPESLPGKILSYFMTNPSISLNKIIATYPKFNYKLDLYPNLNYELKTSIFHLGLILGLYANDPIVPVLGKHDTRIPIHHNQKWRKFKYLSDINCDEEIAKDHTIISLYYPDSSMSKQRMFRAFESVKQYLFKDENTTTLSSLTSLIINANEFLNGSTDTITKGKSVATKVHDALFVFTASTLGAHKKSKTNCIFDTKVIPIPNMYSLQISTERPQFSARWIRSALSCVGLENMAFNSHQLRHWVNHHAKESGIPISVINLWSGRKDADQAYEYIHTIDEDNAQQINSILVNKSEMEPSSEIKFISIKKIKDMRKLPATIMSEGVCTQDLVTMPCRFLNDFMTSCFGCQEMCYIKGDTQALINLKLDLEVQLARLSEVKSHPGFNVNKVSQEWYKTHFNKTAILNILIEVLEDEAISEGSSVRMSGDLSSLEFRVQSLDTAKVAVRQFVLEDSSKSLNKMLTNTESSKNTSNLRLAGLLSSYGVKNGKN